MAWEFWDERLRLLREKTGKTQEDISKVIGTTQQIYSRYETNKTELPVRHLLNLSSYYNVSTDYLLGRIDYPKIAPEFSNSPNSECNNWGFCMQNRFIQQQIETAAGGLR